MIAENTVDQDSGSEKKKGRGGEEWRTHSALMRDAAGWSASYAPWTGQAGIVLRGVPRHDRKLDVIDMAWAHRIAKCRAQGVTDEDAKVNFYVDISQAVQRRPWGNAKTLTQGWSRMQFRVFLACILIRRLCLRRLSFSI